MNLKMTRYVCDNCSPGLSLYNSWLFIRWTLWFINPEEVMFTEANNFCVLFRVLVISYRCTVVNYFVPTKTRPTYICTRCSRAIWAFGGWVVYCTTHGRFSAWFRLKFAMYFLIKAKIIDNWYGNPTSHVNTFSSS